MRTVAILQARMSSSRLPGKVLLEIAGKPMIQHVAERARRARTLDEVVIATTTDESDSPVVLLAESIGVPVTRGSLHDVLDRYYQAARLHKAEVVVRITADCPPMDPALIDDAVNTLKDGGYDFVANRLPPPFTRTYPIGLDVEVCTFPAIERAWKESTESFHREHVMPFLYEGTRLANRTSHLAEGISPRGFRIAQLHNDVDYGSLRWTVDTPEDLEFIRQVFARLGDKPEFTWKDVLAVVDNEPELAAINAGIRHKTMTETDQRATDH